MLTFRLILVVLHICFAAVILGIPLGLPGMIRRALATSSPEALRLASAEAMRRGLVAQIASVLTLLTGVTLILMSGGFGTVTKNFHVALGLMLIAIVFGVAFMRPTVAKLKSGAESSPIPTEQIESLIGKLSMGSGILQTLWLVILVMMLYRF